MVHAIIAARAATLLVASVAWAAAAALGADIGPGSHGICSTEALQACVTSPDSQACAACPEEQVEETEEVMVQDMRVELLQTAHDPFKVRKTPATVLSDALGLKANATELASSPTSATPAPGFHPMPLHDEHGRPVHEPAHSSDKDYRMQAAIPVGAFMLGAVAMVAGQKTAGLLSVYFGAQAGFSLYMKVVLSNASISRELHMKGVPAAFLVTAMQQVVAFIILFSLLAGLWFMPKQWLNLSEPYRPKQLRTPREWLSMLLFAVAFAVNIGLNNFSLSLLTVSLNLIIRSCLPLVTLLMQLLCGTAGRVNPSEVFLMFAGVVFAGLATVCKGHSTHGAGSQHLVLGVLMCSASDFAAALNLVLAAIFGTYMKLNPLDTTFYMAVPTATVLLPAVFLMPHPVEWPGFGLLTDWQVFLKVLELSPYTITLVGISGIFAAGYNLLQYALVQSLSATHAAFAGNFNKAATIMLSICLGLESLPSGMWGCIMVLAILGNILSFTGYSLIKVSDAKQSQGHSAPPGLVRTQSELSLPRGNDDQAENININTNTVLQEGVEDTMKIKG